MTGISRTFVILALLASLLAGLGLGGPQQVAAAASQAGTGGGDIPDSAVYLTYTAPHFRIKFVEGWGRVGSNAPVTFADKDSYVRVVLLATPGGSLESFVRGHELVALRKAGASHIHGPEVLALPAGRSWHLQYLVPSAPDPVTGKIVSLRTDRYYLGGVHRIAVLMLASPVTDDNIDAFRLISHSFAWR